jgi:hypothetical protein
MLTKNNSLEEKILFTIKTFEALMKKLAKQEVKFTPEAF